MKLKNIYHHDLFKTILIIFLTFISIFFAIAINDDYNQISFIYSLYLVFIVLSFALGYLEMANLTVLGMGITRFSIFKKFNISLLILLVLLLIIALYYDQLIILSKKNLERLKISLLIFLSSVILFAGQIGMFIANLRVNKYIGAFICGIIFIGSILVIKLLAPIILINVLLGIISAVLIFINYILIKNVKIEKYF